MCTFTDVSGFPKTHYLHIVPNPRRSDVHPLRKVHYSAAQGSGTEALRVAPRRYREVLVLLQKMKSVSRAIRSSSLL